MKSQDTIVNEIHSIRRQIHEKAKGMIHAEINAYFKETGERLAARYGFKRIGVEEVRDKQY
ncbi:MAG: hypothetical protein LBL96_03530 [Clostridiales bacterium]|nr:hypothetical protein [Clostridiales bacterium]